MRRTYASVTSIEEQLVALYGLDSNALKALDLVMDVMNSDNGFSRDDGSDYYIHCVDVANTLIFYRIKNEDVICAAILHDIIEDVEGYSKVTIEKLFNSNVARLVDLVTKEHGVNYHEDVYLRRYIERIETDPNAAAIKTADRMHNMMTLNNKTFESRYKKALETKTYYLDFFHRCRVKYPRYGSLFHAAKAQIEPLIYTIEAFYDEICRLNHELEKYSSNER